MPLLRARGPPAKQRPPCDAQEFVDARCWPPAWQLRKRKPPANGRRQNIRMLNYAIALAARRAR